MKCDLIHDSLLLLDWVNLIVLLTLHVRYFLCVKELWQMMWIACLKYLNRVSITLFCACVN